MHILHLNYNNIFIKKLNLFMVIYIMMMTQKYRVFYICASQAKYYKQLFIIEI